MKELYAQRLLNSATILREAHEAEAKLIMTLYVMRCGSPGCVLGHYAERTDMQKLMHIHRTAGEWAVSAYYMSYNILPADFGKRADYADVEIRRHFGITREEASELFSEVGCNSAKTPLQAAKYIEKFLADRDWYIKEVA